MNAPFSKTFFVFSTLMLTSTLWAASVTIESPDKAQTNAEGRVMQGSLKWLPKEQALYADITFTNDLYVTRGNALEQEYFLFKFPGVSFDPSTNTFYATAKDGQRVPVAVKKPGVFGGSIQPLPGTTINIYKSHGEVQVVLTATTDQVDRGILSHWVERNSGFSLKSVVSR
jgi:hypothetical protein